MKLGQYMYLYGCSKSDYIGIPIVAVDLLMRTGTRRKNMRRLTNQSLCYQKHINDLNICINLCQFIAADNTLPESSIQFR